jgi:hypothetical protein
MRPTYDGRKVTEKSSQMSSRSGVWYCAFIVARTAKLEVTLGFDELGYLTLQHVNKRSPEADNIYDDRAIILATESCAGSTV